MVVWYENAASVQLKANAARAAGVGVSMWAMGEEDASFWDAVYGNPVPSPTTKPTRHPTAHPVHPTRKPKRRPTHKPTRTRVPTNKSHTG